MDFYTLSSKLDLNEPKRLNHVLQSIGFFTQPMLIGQPNKDKKGYFLRFAVRGEGLSLKEEDFLELVCTNSDFTPENTSLERSEHV